MNGGLINCECGQEFYCETVNDSIKCIRCGKSQNVYPLPEPEVIVEESDIKEGDQ
jgi:hypothetical protein